MGTPDPAPSAAADGSANGEKTDPYALRPEDNGYRFTVESDLATIDAEPTAVVGPRGTRMHVVYGQDSTISVDRDKCTSELYAKRPRYRPDHFQELYRSDTGKQKRERLINDKRAWQESGWKGLQGMVLSGSDFLQVRTDGVVELDGRVTLRADDDTLIDATYAGLIDLDALLPPPPPARAINDIAKVSPGYQQFVSGKFPETILPLNLFITFDTSTGPWSTENAEDTTWTKPSQLRHRGNVWKYAELVRRQYIGEGKMIFKYTADRLPKPQKISVDVYDVASFRGGVK